MKLIEIYNYISTMVSLCPNMTTSQMAATGTGKPQEFSTTFTKSAHMKCVITCAAYPTNELYAPYDVETCLSDCGDMRMTSPHVIPSQVNNAKLLPLGMSQGLSGSNHQILNAVAIQPWMIKQ